MRPSQRLVQITVSALWLCAGHTAYASTAPAIDGRWQTFDEHTRLPASIVRIAVEGDKASGKIEELMKAGTSPDDKCTMCEGDNKNKPIVGLKIVWDLTLDGDSWEGGSVLDPANGKIYRCKMKRISDKELEVRGYLGISLFGRSQTWARLADDSAPPQQQVPPGH